MTWFDLYVLGFLLHEKILGSRRGDENGCGWVLQRMCLMESVWEGA